MAISLAYDIVFAMFITLILISAEYLILEDIKRLFSRLTGKRTDENPEPATEGISEGDTGGATA